MFFSFKYFVFKLMFGEWFLLFYIMEEVKSIDNFYRIFWFLFNLVLKCDNKYYVSFCLYKKL